MLRVLIADTDRTFGASLQKRLSGLGDVAVEVVRTAPEALARAADLVFLSSEFMGSLEPLKRARPKAEVVVTAAESRIEDAIRAMKQGAADYAAKPLRPEQIAVAVERARRASGSNGPASAAPDEGRLTGTSAGIARANEAIARAAGSNDALLIMGEAGTESERAARAVHAGGSRASQPFVAVACRGAGADDVAAALERAGRGSVFLDEVGALDAATQDLLMHGPPKGRLIAASAMNLLEAVGRGTFRRDLLQRLSTLTLALPPLRERRDDIALLVEAHLRRRAASGAKSARDVEGEAAEALTAHAWPGNVTELEHAVDRACELGDGERLERRHLPPSVIQSGEERRLGEATGGATTRSLREMESQVIAKLLTEHHGNTDVVSRLLKIDRSTLYRKIKRYAIDLDNLKDDESGA